MNYDNDDDEDDSEFNNWIVNSSPKPVPKLFTTTVEEDYGPKPVKVRPPKIDEDGQEIEDDGYRKPWACPNGRPVNENLVRSDVMASMKMTVAQHALYIALGGSTWLKEQLLTADVERDKCKRLKEKDRIAAVRLKRELKLKQLKDSQ